MSYAVFGRQEGRRRCGVSLDFQNAPLRRVCEKITQVAGYKILIDQKFKNIPVSASVKGVSLNEGGMRNVDILLYTWVDDVEKESGR